ncbi:hypothetical protein CMI38_05385 [Candidatus Pacearchaeota archaeon]|nr:hypothetical protein [Candidatus Pacearchaeota archaeon]|tara:strand:+ start:2978 stop:3469 length:492 start_codon:yes stop_codon:yes gene_type:complete
MDLRDFKFETITFEKYVEYLNYWGISNTNDPNNTTPSYCRITKPIVYANSRWLLQDFLEDDRANKIIVFKNGNAFSYPRKGIKEKQIREIEKIADEDHIVKNRIRLQFKKYKRSKNQTVTFREYNDQLISYICYIQKYVSAKRLQETANPPEIKFNQGIWTPF